jgi:hypothetical protein
VLGRGCPRAAISQEMNEFNDTGRLRFVWSAGLAQHYEPLWWTAPTRSIGLPISCGFEADRAYGDFIGSRIATAYRATKAPDIGQLARGG